MSTNQPKHSDMNDDNSNGVDTNTSSNDTKEAGASGSTGEANEKKDADWVCVGHESGFGARTQIKVHSRMITILRLTGRAGGAKWVAIDSICYHAGGPLTEGKLKQVAGRTCLQCPWHSYLIDVFSGEGLYMDLDRRYRSKGVRQRVHEVEERAGHVWVRLKEDGAVASDHYAFGARFGAAEGLREFPGW